MNKNLLSKKHLYLILASIIFVNYALAATQSDLLNAQLNYQTAKSHYDDDNANLADAQDNVTQARINLAQAESNLVNAKHDLVVKIREESQAKSTLDAANSELNKASNIVQNMWDQQQVSQTSDSAANTTAQ